MRYFLQSNRLALKSIALLLAAAFLGQDLAFSAFETPSLARPESFRPEAPSTRAFDPMALDVPLENVTVKEAFRGRSGKLVIHIQDAHTNLSGQQNLARAIDRVMKRHGLTTVYAEGASSDVTLDGLKKIIAPERLPLAAERFLRDGMISGQEYLNLTSSLPMRIVGVEDEELARKSLEAYAGLKKRRAAAIDYLDRIAPAVSFLKDRFYPAEVVAYEKSKTADLAADSGPAALLRLREIAGTSLSRYPETAKMAALLGREKEIDFTRASLEQAVLCERLAAAVGESGLKDLAGERSAAGASRAGQALFLHRLFSLAGEKGVSFAEMKELSKYREYLEAFSGVRMDVLVGELESLEEEIYDKLLPEGPARKTRAIERFTALMRKAYRTQLSSREFDLLVRSRAEFPTAGWEGFVNGEILASGGAVRPIPYDTVLEDSFAAVRRFYGLVDRRDFAFVEKAAADMESRKLSAGFLVTGGYHTEHLTKLLRERDISYLVLTPHVTSETNLEKYESLLLMGLDSKNSPKQSPEAFRDNTTRSVDLLDTPSGAARWLRMYGDNAPILTRAESGEVGKYLSRRRAGARLMVSTVDGGRLSPLPTTTLGPLAMARIKGKVLSLYSTPFIKRPEGFNLLDIRVADRAEGPVVRFESRVLWGVDEDPILKRYQLFEAEASFDPAAATIFRIYRQGSEIRMDGPGGVHWRAQFVDVGSPSLFSERPLEITVSKDGFFVLNRSTDTGFTLRQEAWSFPVLTRLLGDAVRNSETATAALERIRPALGDDLSQLDLSMALSALSMVRGSEGMQDRQALIYDLQQRLIGYGKRRIRNDYARGNLLGVRPEPVLRAALSPDGETMALAGGATARLVKADGAPASPALEEYGGNAVASAISPDGQVLAIADERGAGLWNAVSGTFIRRLEGLDGSINQLAFSPDGRIIAASNDRTARFWSAASGDPVGEPLTGHRGTITALAFSPDGGIFATSSFDRTIRLWDAADGRFLRELAGHAAVVHSIAFSPDGRTLASASGDRTVRIWNVSGEGSVRVLQSPRGPLYKVRFSPAGKKVGAVSSLGEISLWRTPSGRLLQTLASDDGEVRDFIFSPDGQYVLAAAGKSVNVWRASTGGLLAAFKDHGYPLVEAGLSPDGREILSVSQEEVRVEGLRDLLKGPADGARLVAAAKSRFSHIAGNVDVDFSQMKRIRAAVDADGAEIRSGSALSLLTGTVNGVKYFAKIIPNNPLGLREGRIMDMISVRRTVGGVVPDFSFRRLTEDDIRAIPWQALDGTEFGAEGLRRRWLADPPYVLVTKDAGSDGFRTMGQYLDELRTQVEESGSAEKVLQADFAVKTLFLALRKAGVAHRDLGTEGKINELFVNPQTLDRIFRQFPLETLDPDDPAVQKGIVSAFRLLDFGLATLEGDREFGIDRLGKVPYRVDTADKAGKGEYTRIFLDKGPHEGTLTLHGAAEFNYFHRLGFHVFYRDEFACMSISRRLAATLGENHPEERDHLESYYNAHHNALTRYVRKTLDKTVTPEDSLEMQRYLQKTHNGETLRANIRRLQDFARGRRPFNVVIKVVFGVLFFPVTLAVFAYRYFVTGNLSGQAVPYETIELRAPPSPYREPDERETPGSFENLSLDESGPSGPINIKKAGSINIREIEDGRLAVTLEFAENVQVEGEADARKGGVGVRHDRSTPLRRKVSFQISREQLLRDGAVIELVRGAGDDAGFRGRRTVYARVKLELSGPAPRMTLDFGGTPVDSSLELSPSTWAPGINSKKATVKLKRDWVQGVLSRARAAVAAAQTRENDEDQTGDGARLAADRRPLDISWNESGTVPTVRQDQTLALTRQELEDVFGSIPGARRLKIAYGDVSVAGVPSVRIRIEALTEDGEQLIVLPLEIPRSARRQVLLLSGTFNGPYFNRLLAQQGVTQPNELATVVREIYGPFFERLFRVLGDRMFGRFAVGAVVNGRSTFFESMNAGFVVERDASGNAYNVYKDLFPSAVRLRSRPWMSWRPSAAVRALIAAAAAFTWSSPPEQAASSPVSEVSRPGARLASPLAGKGAFYPLAENAAPEDVAAIQNTGYRWPRGEERFALAVPGRPRSVLVEVKGERMILSGRDGRGVSTEISAPLTAVSAGIQPVDAERPSPSDVGAFKETITLLTRSVEKAAPALSPERGALKPFTPVSLVRNFNRASLYLNYFILKQTSLFRKNALEQVFVAMDPADSKALDDAIAEASAEKTRDEGFIGYLEGIRASLKDPAAFSALLAAHDHEASRLVFIGSDGDFGGALKNDAFRGLVEKGLVSISPVASPKNQKGASDMVRASISALIFAQASRAKEAQDLRLYYDRAAGYLEFVYRKTMSASAFGDLVTSKAGFSYGAWELPPVGSFLKDLFSRAQEGLRRAVEAAA